MLLRYYKVGKLLHFMAAFALLVAFYASLRLAVVEYDESPLDWLIWAYVTISFFIMFILAEMDGYSRYQNYKQVKDQIYLNGYQERLLKPLSRSSCQREAAVLAGDELGVGQEVRSYYHAKGYRWYHIIPDFVFQYPLFFFSSFFWRTTFFTPYYKPKVDYSGLDLAKVDLILKGLRLETTA